MAEKKSFSILLLYGGIAALVMILFTLGTYWAGPEPFVGRVAYLKFVLIIALAIVAGIAAKKQAGFLGFKPALRVCFGTIVIGMAVQTLFAWVLLNFIDTHFKSQTMPFVIAQAERTYRNFNFSEEDIARMVADVKAGDPFSFGSMLAGLARIYIVLFLVSLLLAAAVGQKKRV